jgi:DNA modification methylase
MKPYYQDEWATIYHGDCREILLSLAEVGLVLTDPPYGIGLRNNGRRDGKRRDKDWTIAGDADQAVGQWALDVCAARAWATIAFASPMRAWAGSWRQHLVWDKGEHVGGGGDPATCWKSTWELVQVARTGVLRGSRDGAIIRVAAVKEDYAHHPSPKPAALMNYLIRKVADGTGAVLDPFMGLGPTLRAAKDLGRRSIGIELEERYCEIAARRLSQEVLDLGVA